MIITGRATVATSLLRQNGKLVLHMVNLTGADNQAATITNYTPVGPLKSAFGSHQARVGESPTWPRRDRGRPAWSLAPERLDDWSLSSPTSSTTRSSSSNDPSIFFLEQRPSKALSAVGASK